jgi:hypothetical protein
MESTTRSRGPCASGLSRAKMGRTFQIPAPRAPSAFYLSSCTHSTCTDMTAATRHTTIITVATVVSVSELNPPANRHPRWLLNGAGAVGRTSSLPPVPRPPGLRVLTATPAASSLTRSTQATHITSLRAAISLTATPTALPTPLRRRLRRPISLIGRRRFTSTLPTCMSRPTLVCRTFNLGFLPKET